MSATSETETPLSRKEQRAAEKERQRLLKYYSASQWTLIWWRFRRHRAAMLAAGLLILMAILGLFAEFVAPYGPTTRDTNYLDGAPQIPKFCDQNGCSLQPFIHGVKTERDPNTLRAISVPDPETRIYVRLLAPGEDIRILGIIPTDRHLFGLSDSDAKIHFWGTDDLGRDVFSRTIYATRTSLSIGVLGVLISFVLALVIGGTAGYFGGRIDAVIQRVTEIIRVVPIIPLYMGLAAAMPKEWSTTQVYFAMTLILGLFGWPTLARRIRSQLLSIRNEDYVVAARLAGARPGRIISQHMLPSFTSFIIVDLVISFPYMILSETALSFVGLGLRPPTVSWGVLLQQAQSIRAIEQTPWLFIPAILVVAAVLAFTIIGDGLRDAADPYGGGKVMENMLTVEDLSISFRTDEGKITPVQGVSFSVKSGKTLGLVGESGSGKSISTKALMRLLPGTASLGDKTRMHYRSKDGRSVEIEKLDVRSNQVRALRGSEIGMIFQEPMASFSPVYTIGNQMMEAIRLHRNMGKREARAFAVEMLDKVGISNPGARIDQYAHEMSGGMRQRAMIALTLSAGPQLLIADEPTTALDVTIQAQVLELMRGLQEDLGMGMIFITHDLGVIAQIADEVAVMYLGTIVERGPTREVIRNPLHPYTVGLLEAIPSLEKLVSRLRPVPGDIPSPHARPTGCPFHTRCSKAIKGVCEVNAPAETVATEGHAVRCFLHQDEGRNAA